MSKYIIDTDQFEKLFETKAVAVLGIGDNLAVPEEGEKTVWTRMLNVADLEELTSDYINEHFGSLQDDAYKRGLEDAWEAARKIADMWTRIDDDELLAIFGITERIGYSTIRSMFEKQTANEAMLELEAYEEKQKADDEIKIGDEVETEDGKRFVVTTFGSSIDGDIAVGVCADGLGLGVDLKELHKTGRHFDIASILEEMKHD